MDFKSKVDLEISNCTLAVILGISKETILSIDTEKVTISWSNEFVCRDWGYNTYVHIPNQEIEVSYSFLDNNDQEVEVKNVKIPLKDIGNTFTSNDIDCAGLWAYQLCVEEAEAKLVFVRNGA